MTLNRITTGLRPPERYRHYKPRYIIGQYAVEEQFNHARDAYTIERLEEMQKRIESVRSTVWRLGI